MWIILNTNNDVRKNKDWVKTIQIDFFFNALKKITIKQEQKRRTAKTILNQALKQK